MKENKITLQIECIFSKNHPIFQSNDKIEKKTNCISRLRKMKHQKMQIVNSQNLLKSIHLYELVHSLSFY